MKAKITLTIAFEKSAGASGDVNLQTADDVLDYIRGTIESNAQFDSLEIAVKEAMAEEIQRE